MIPVAGSLTAGFFLARYFLNARGSGIPQTKTALGKFSICAIPLPAELRYAVKGPRSTSPQAAPQQDVLIFHPDAKR